MSDEPGSSPASIEVAMLDAAWDACVPDAEAIVTSVADACLQRALPAAAAGRALEVSVVLTDDAQVRELNARHRGQDKATNVLSFPTVDWHGAPNTAALGRVEGAPLLLGDVVLARQTLLAEAVAQAKAPGDHLAHLAAHGVLHLLGYDHEDEGPARAMEALEVSILESFGIADPYRGQPAVSRAAAAETSPKHKDNKHPIS